MFKRLLITLFFVLGSVPAFAQVETAGTMRYDGAQDSREVAKYVLYNTCCDLRGDVTDDGAINVPDLGYLIDYLFFGGPAPPCFEEGDVDASGAINIVDVTYLVDYLFFGGLPPAPCPPKK